MKRILITCAVVGALALVTATAEDVKVAYKNQCAKCHGEDGKGETKMGKKSGVKDYTDPKVQDAMKDEKAFKSIKEGMKEGDKTLMKPFDTLSDTEIKDLVKYMRTFKKA
jgi:mono/diheme cytochrome c family protein